MTAAVKHSPGPWRVQRNGMGGVYIESAAAYDPVTEARAVIVATIPLTRSGNPFWRQDEEVVPNANLVAAAPEMLAALRECHFYMKHYVATHGPGPEKALAALERAVAAAERKELPPVPR